MEERITALTQLLRRHGLRMTPQRIEIIRAIVELPTHPSAEAVFQKVRQQHPSISLATVYNTIDKLARLGALQEVGGGGERRFDARNPRPHGHCVCRLCGGVEDVPLPSGWEKLHRGAREHAFRAEALQVTLLGVCSACRDQD